jgi:NADPH:quinone reductase-like Zn-dependent oxidoreductase
MKAWQIQNHGGSEALSWRDLPDPEPSASEAKIRVEFVGLNHLDVWVRKGVPGHQFPLPIIPGCDMVGKIEKLGPLSAREKVALESQGLNVGTQVLVNPGVSCGKCKACLGGNDPLCRFYGILGETENGGCAEWAVVPTANLIPLPANVLPEEAAALPIAYLTAYSMLFQKAKLLPGEVILIQAAASGVSSAAIQLAKMIGARVITTASTPEKTSRARQLGADFVLDARSPTFRDDFRKIMGKRGCDVVLDHVGQDTFGESIKCLNRGGRLVTCGATSGAEVKLDLKVIFFKNISIFGTTMGSKADLISLLGLLAEKKIRPPIDRVLPLSDLPKALELLEERKIFGKLVLRQA